MKRLSVVALVLASLVVIPAAIPPAYAIACAPRICDTSTNGCTSFCCNRTGFGENGSCIYDDCEIWYSCPSSGGRPQN